ncbi:MAG: putative inorganic carbon transporter subunit DabA, partial [Sedimenticolaceae bacterium]
MSDQLTQDAAVAAGQAERWTDPAVDAVCGRFAPFWPLDAMVATNPYLGFVGQHFDAAAEYHRRIIGRPMTMNRDWFREQIAGGRISDADLEEALARSGSDLDLAGLRAAVEEPVPLAIPQLLYSHMRDGRYRPSHSGYVVQQTSQFCAAYYDLGQAIWPMPRFGDGLYESWWHYTLIDRSPRGMDILNVPAVLRTLPDSPRGAIQVAVERMRVPADRLEDFLYVALATLGGWASYTRHLRWVAELEGGRNDDIVDLLAIRVVWEALLVGTCERPAHREQWMQSLRCWPHQLRPTQARALEVNLILQRALEIGYQHRLVAGLRRANGERIAAPRPVAQAAFCIDVRSEVFRRALETADGAIETQGFAGFFGIMAEYRPLGAAHSRTHLPVLLPPRYRVCESAGDGGGARTVALLAQRKRILGLSKAWKQFKLSSASCFSFVESAGLLYVLKLVTDSLGWTRPVPHPETAGLGRLDTAALGPDLDAASPAGEEDDASWGIPRDERAGVAAFILNAMGLKSRFAPIVLLAGHGSSTVNNPQRAGLDCGACAGQTGEASVRMATAILNDPAVRDTLAERGQPIPD